MPCLFLVTLKWKHWGTIRDCVIETEEETDMRFSKGSIEVEAYWRDEGDKEEGLESEDIGEYVKSW